MYVAVLLGGIRDTVVWATIAGNHASAAVRVWSQTEVVADSVAVPAIFLAGIEPVRLATLAGVVLAHQGGAGQQRVTV